MHKYPHARKSPSACSSTHSRKQAEAVIDEIVRFCLDVGLPVTLSDLGLRKYRRRPAAPGCRRRGGAGQAVSQPAPPREAGMIYDAIRAADALGREKKTGSG
jgi:glycerol dehydrogenase